ncbi:hypothetical protein DS884_02850 [Tenacibaculum sp. E3R01]|uniref:hypothetical protein n=1 Tax=Tenacibaculum sp. E3R01 TaxID=2267227 RepID=UPI000DE91879|nr:hypothetical protein [Tenacibaculum sp. E3R01]RBW61959.1 hypothetical protein DS884_02850 [Tenacibaculum sp. E3R01]
MKKLLLIIILLNINHLISQEISGLWYLKSEKVINRSQGWKPMKKGLLIDFDKSEISHISMDSVVKINIDYKNNIISKTGEIDILKFQRFKNDSIRIRFPESNTISTFHKINVIKNITKPKNKIIEFFDKKCFLPIRDSLKLEFNKSKSLNPNLELGKMMKLESKFLENKEQIGNWYLTEKDSMFFIGICINIKNREYNVYQIKSIERNVVKLIGLIEFDFLPNLTELKACL